MFATAVRRVIHWVEISRLDSRYKRLDPINIDKVIEIEVGRRCLVVSETDDFNDRKYYHFKDRHSIREESEIIFNKIREYRSSNN